MGDLKRINQPGIFEAIDYSFLNMKVSVQLSNGACRGDEIEGDLIVSYEFNGSHHAQQHVTLTLDQPTLFGLGPFQVKARAQQSVDGVLLLVTLRVGQLKGRELRIAICEPRAGSLPKSLAQLTPEEPVKAGVSAKTSRPSRSNSTYTWLGALRRMLKKCFSLALEILKALGRECVIAFSQLAAQMGLSTNQAPA